MPCIIDDSTVWNEHNHKSKSLDFLLDSIKVVSFESYFESIGHREPKQKHYLVAIIEILLKEARQQHWDLSKDGDFIYFFNKCYWENIHKDDLKMFLMQTAIKQGYSELECKGYEFQDKLLKQFLSLAKFEKKKYYANKVVINTLNTTVEIDGDIISTKAFNKDDFLTYQLPFYYQEKAIAPSFIRFLDEVLPDKDSQKVLQEFCGYVFTRNLKLEKCLILKGSGANGKSVFVDIMNALLGKDNITNYSLASLSQEHNRANIKNALVNWGYEINGNIDHDTFKNLISGEPIQARLKYGNSFIMTDYAKLAFNGNSLPTQVEHNEAFYRRFLIIPFDVTIAEDKREPDLAKTIIEDELSGVFNWVIDGLKRLIAQKRFTESIKVKETLDLFKKESDTIALFIDDNDYKESIYNKKSTRDLFGEYCLYCKEGGYKNVNIKNFSTRMKYLKFKHIKSNGFSGFYIEK